MSMYIRTTNNHKDSPTPKCRNCEYKCQKCADIRLEEAKTGDRTPHVTGESLCWCCSKAVPKEGCDCEWSLYNKPVPHWEAIEHSNDGLTSYRVIRCPRFERGRD